MRIVDWLKRYAQNPAKLLLLTLIVMGIIYGVFIGVSLLPGRSSYLVLENKIYFEIIDNTTLRVTTYLTNDGLSTSGDVKVTMFVKDSKSGVTLSKSDKNVGVILSECTSEAILTTTSPTTQNFSIELLVFENGKKLEQGAYTTTSLYYGATTGQGELAMQPRTTEKTTIPGFETLAIISSLIIAVPIFKKFKFK